MNKITERDYRDYLKLTEEGHSQRSACLILGLTRSSIQRYIKKQIDNEDDDKPLENKAKVLFYDCETTLARSSIS